MTDVFRLRNEGLEWRLIEGEVVVLDEASSSYLSVNRAGGVLWVALAQGATIQELSSLLATTFDISPESAGADALAFLDVLESRGLIDRR